MTDGGRLHHDAVVVDCHNDLILLVAHHAERGRPGYFAERWLPELRAGGVDVQVLPIFIEDQFRPEGSLRRALLLLEQIRRLVDDHADDVALCQSAAEIDEAVASGRIALVAALEGCEPIGSDLPLLRTFHRLGVRMASFTHFGRTALADGSGEDAAGGGLTRAGVAAVAEMEELGILVDVSHLSARGTDQVLELATRPVVASHSSCRALCDHHRNLTDDRLAGVAATGGVVGINLFPGFLDEKDPTLDRAVDHLAHAARAAGWDHVGLGPDFLKEYAETIFPEGMVVEGLELGAAIPGLQGSSTDLPHMTAAMLERGLSDGHVRGVLGDNFLRVFREVWA